MNATATTPEVANISTLEVGEHQIESFFSNGHRYYNAEQLMQYLACGTFGEWLAKPNVGGFMTERLAEYEADDDSGVNPVFCFRHEGAVWMDSVLGEFIAGNIDARAEAELQSAALADSIARHRAERREKLTPEVSEQTTQVPLKIGIPSFPES